METDDGRLVRWVGTGGVVAMLLTHLVWDPALTLVGVAEVGVAEEDTAVVRTLLRVHPLAWLGAKLAAVGGFAAVFVGIGAHRDLATAWVPWLVALVGLVAPLGWLELLV